MRNPDPEGGPVCVPRERKVERGPYSTLLVEHFWSAAVPTLREAVLAGYWTVKVVTDLRAQSVGCGVADSTACRAIIPRDAGPGFHGMPGHRSTVSRAG